MKHIISLLIGYFFGTLNPAALLSKIKKKDLRSVGTKNLGATNTMLNFGKRYGALVLLLDMAKTVVACVLTKLAFPTLTTATMVAGIGAILGHIFPFYMKFKGGKGLAAFAGLVLAFDPIVFLILLVVCTAIMIIVNYSIGMPISAAILFPFFVGFKTYSVPMIILAAASGLIIIISHFEIISRIRSNNENKIRDTMKRMFAKKS